MPCSPQVQVSRLIEDRLLWILAMDEKMTPLDCLLPSGTAFQTHIPSPEKHMHTINQIWRFMHRCICLFFSVVVVVLSYTNYTLAWGTHPHTDDLNASDQNSRLLASLSHLSSSLCFSHSLRHTVFGELELKNKSLALSWQQCTYVWDMPSLLFCWKGFLMFLL